MLYRICHISHAKHTEQPKKNHRKETPNSLNSIRCLINKSQWIIVTNWQSRNLSWLSQTRLTLLHTMKNAFLPSNCARICPNTRSGDIELCVCVCSMTTTTPIYRRQSKTLVYYKLLVRARAHTCVCVCWLVVWTNLHNSTNPHYAMWDVRSRIRH